MRAGIILRTVGCIIFVAGLIGGVLIIIGVEYFTATYSGEIISKDNLVAYSWVAAVYVLVSSGFLACLIFTIGSMSNNLSEINIKMEDVQSNTFESAKALRYIAHVVDERLVKKASNGESSGAEPNTQYVSRNYMQSKSNSTED